MRDIHQKYKDKGVVVIGLSNEDESKVRTYVSQNGIPYPIGIGSMSGGAYGVRGIPASFLIDPEGKIAWSGHPAGGLAQAIEQALVKTPPTVEEPTITPPEPAVKPPEPVVEDPEARQKAAQILLDSGLAAKGESRWADAWKDFEKISKVYADTPAAAEAKKEMDALKANPAAWKAIVASQSGAEAERLLNLARMALKNGQGEMAIRYFDELIAKFPDSPQAAAAKRERPR